jgi:formyltetrahydrofolate deformylase
MSSYVLRISCEDRVGLIHLITGVIFSFKLNITSNHEYVDPESLHFYMRSEFSGSFDRQSLYDNISAILPRDASLEITEIRKKNIVILVTKEHHCVGDLLLKNEFGNLTASISAVISNYPDLGSLSERFGIPYHFVSHEGMERGDHESEIIRIIEHYDPEYIVLAKYMRILSENFVNRYPDRIINIHHSFLPAFVGASPYMQAYRRGVKIIGATAHFVNGSLDEGPIIAQNVINVSHFHSHVEMKRAGMEVEKTTLARALNLVFNDRVFVSGNRTIVFE